ncbi:uncharacterized protein LOC109856105, partial [Pseudomyrmex gracilis]|uniref:uncharacterized protein LOC109856105 n=1 Tax=Pseudomyrmex gracilis TaxID=219809 RepID=UPI000994BA22
METDNKRVKSDVKGVQTSEEAFEEILSLSPIDEESELILCCKKASSTFTISETPESVSSLITSCEEQPTDRLDISRCEKGDSVTDSFGNEQIRQEHDQYERKAEASGDNDEAISGLREKSLKTTVEQLKCRLSQAEKEIVVLKKQRSPRKCPSHEKCEILQKDLLSWRNDHEKRLNAQMIKWELAEKRIYDEMENTRMIYDNIQRHLEVLEKQSTRVCSDFRRQIDMWEKKLKDDIASIHENNLMELREQVRAWLEMRDTISLSSVRNEKECETCKVSDIRSDKKHDRSCKSQTSELTMLHEDNGKFLRRIERIIKFEVQQHRDDLSRQTSQKIAELRSAFENFKHNFYLDRNYVKINTSEIAGSAVETRESNDLECQDTARSDLNASSAEK